MIKFLILYLNSVNKINEIHNHFKNKRDYNLNKFIIYFIFKNKNI